MKDKIRLEVMKVFNQEADVDTVVGNILHIFHADKNKELLMAFIDDHNRYNYEDITESDVDCFLNKTINYVEKNIEGYKIIGKNRHGIIAMNMNPDNNDVCIICKFENGCRGIPCYSKSYYLPLEEVKLDIATIPDYNC